MNGAFYINGIADWKKEILNTGAFDEMLAYLTYHLTAGISWHIIYTVLDISVLAYYNMPAAIPGMIKSRVITQWLRNNTKLLFYRAKCYPNIIICDSFF